MEGKPTTESAFEAVCNYLIPMTTAQWLSCCSMNYCYLVINIAMPITRYQKASTDIPLLMDGCMALRVRSGAEDKTVAISYFLIPNQIAHPLGIYMMFYQSGTITDYFSEVISLLDFHRSGR